MRASLPQSIAATILMIGLPLIVVWVSSQVLYFWLPTVAAILLSLALSFLCSAVVARIWERRSKTAEISFGELMLWSWYRLSKAEHGIEQGLVAAETAASHDEQLQVLHELTAALESKDPYTRGHSRRVERHAFKTGVAMGLPLAEVEVLRMSASLHDVGKIRVPNKVLHKTGSLSAQERALIEEHPVLGAQMVASIGDDQIVQAVRHHHERWDGAGYPDGTAGTETPLFARVIAVADSYDAIRSNRSYRTGASRDEAVQILTDESGHQLDAEVVEAFLTTLPARGRAVAAVTSLATGPGALWRYLQQLLQRFGSTALAPALGAAGAAVIIGSSSLLTPATPVLASPTKDLSKAVASPTTVPAGMVEISDADRAAAEETAGRRAARKQDRRVAQRQERRAAQRKNRRGTAVAAAGGSGASTSPTSPTETAQNDPPTGSTAAPTTGGDAQGTEGDPNQKGKDCKPGERERSKGYRFHCG